MKQSFVVAILTLLIGAACGSQATENRQLDKTSNQAKIITVFRSPSWGCCGDWIAYMEENGYQIRVENTADLNSIKAQYQVPPELQSCHTAIVDGYVVEGHVPVADVQRLVNQHPDIRGIAVAGMPAGSPGMEVDGIKQPYEVVAFDETGKLDVWSRYNQ